MYVLHTHSSRHSHKTPFSPLKKKKKKTRTKKKLAVAINY